MTGFLSILLGLSLVSVSSFGLTRRGQFKGVVSNTLAFAIITYATTVLIAQVLSELGMVHRLGFLMGHLIIVVLLLPWTITLYRPDFVALLTMCANRWRDLRQLAAAHSALAVLGLFVLAAMALGAYLILVVPPNTYDSLSYHLTRVAYWLDRGTLHHFQTPDPIKIVHQGYNSEIALLWLTVLWGNDQLTGFVQWVATILTMLVIYGFARQLKFSLTASIFAALIWSTFTVVVLQATSTKNDTLVALLVLTCLHFLRLGLYDPRKYSPNLIISGLALGLALGAKSMVALVVPGLVIGCLGLLRLDHARFLPRLIYAAAWSVFGFFAFGFYNYALNLINYQLVSGSVELVSRHTVQNPTLATFVTNLSRIIFHFFDPGGLPDSLVHSIQQWRPALAENLFALLNIAPNIPEANLNTFRFDGVRQVTPREDAAWYGPLGFFLFLPAMLYYLVISPFREKDIWKWFTALMTASFIIMFAIFVRWQTHMGRFLLISVVLGAPLFAGFYSWSERYKILRWGVIAVGLVVLSWSATHNFHKTVLGSNNIWGQDYYELRTIQNPRLAAAYRYLDQQMPVETNLGIVGGYAFVRWDYLFFGPDLKRSVQFLGSELSRIDRETFATNQVDYLVIGAYPPYEIESEAPLWPIIEEDGLHWFLVKRSEAELFANPLQPDLLQQALGADYQSFREIETILAQESQPIRVMTTDPRMPYFTQNQQIEFVLSEEFETLQGFTHLVVAPWWSATDYERLDISVEEIEVFLGEEKFVKKIAEVNEYRLYRILF